MIRSCDAIVVGAGPAGLATSHELSRLAVHHVILERGEQIGQTWANLYENLVLHTAKGLSALPGLSFPASTPRFPTRRDMLAYLHRYADTFELPVETHVNVVSLHQVAGSWIAQTASGAEFHASAVVIATGIVSNPFVPEIPGRECFGGRVLHSVEYHRPEGFRAQRVLVVGAGNSAGEISVELAHAGADVTVAVRTGALIVPREIAGIPIQYFSLALARLPKRAQAITASTISRVSALARGSAALPPPRPSDCPNVPLIGLHFADLLREKVIRLEGGLAEFTRDGVRFADDSLQRFDSVILATGYRAAVGMLKSPIGLDDCGFARRRDGVVSLDQPNLYFVGHNYDLRGGLFNIGRDARLAARRIRAALPDRSRTSTGTPPPPSEK